jgi:hypothetical protein
VGFVASWCGVHRLPADVIARCRSPASPVCSNRARRAAPRLDRYMARPGCPVGVASTAWPKSSTAVRGRTGPRWRAGGRSRSRCWAGAAARGRGRLVGDHVDGAAGERGGEQGDQLGGGRYLDAGQRGGVLALAVAALTVDRGAPWRSAMCLIERGPVAGRLPPGPCARPRRAAVVVVVGSARQGGRRGTRRPAPQPELGACARSAGVVR